MKKLLLLACCIGWLSPVCAADAFSMNYEDRAAISTMIGLWAPSYDEARKSLVKDQKFPLTVTLRNGDDGEQISYVISSPDDLPDHNVPVACPAGEFTIGQCWFVKYGDQW